jgi:hypothetical protein
MRQRRRVSRGHRASQFASAHNGCRAMSARREAASASRRRQRRRVAAAACACGVRRPGRATQPARGNFMSFQPENCGAPRSRRPPARARTRRQACSWLRRGGAAARALARKRVAEASSRPVATGACRPRARSAGAAAPRV